MSDMAYFQVGISTGNQNDHLMWPDTFFALHGIPVICGNLIWAVHCGHSGMNEPLFCVTDSDLKTGECRRIW